MQWVVLAPGPSMSKELAESVRGRKVCVVCNSFELAPWADVLVSSDRVWWKQHPLSLDFSGSKFAAQKTEGVEQVMPCTFGTSSNSGVLALDHLRNIGATSIVMLGFDSQGSHFFGQYRNKCRNTPERRRQEHRMQFKTWAVGNKSVKVINSTPGSKIDAFPMAPLESVLNG